MIEIKNLSKTFTTSNNQVEALKNVSLTIADGDIYGIIGMSGAGKSTLVRCINMLEKPTEGQVIIDGVVLNDLDEKQLRDIRHNITMIFQGFNLLMQRNVLKNVMFPLELIGTKKEEAEKRAYELLDVVGLKDKANAYPAQLSGGQRQRVAIARALATSPKVLLCDEATSALDPTTTNSILNLIQEINEKLGITVIIITHQMSVVETVCKHVAIIDEGQIAEVGEVSEVFSSPKSKAAKKLVFPEGDVTELLTNDGSTTYIRVVFNGAESTEKPLIAHMAVEKGIEASIVHASVRNIEGRAYGSMLLGVPSDKEVDESVLSYLKQSGLLAEEVNND